MRSLGAFLKKPFEATQNGRLQTTRRRAWAKGYPKTLYTDAISRITRTEIPQQKIVRAASHFDSLPALRGAP